MMNKLIYQTMVKMNFCIKILLVLTKFQVFKTEGPTNFQSLNIAN